MDSITQYLVAVPALPLAAAVLTALLGPRVLKGRSHLLTIGAFIAAFVCSLLLVREVHTKQSEISESTLNRLESPSTIGHTSAAVASFERIVTLWTWADLPDAYQLPKTSTVGTPSSNGDSGWRPFRIDVALRADGLTAMMLAMVTGVAALVAIFAAGYMHGDRGYWRFFSYVSLFVFSMTMLVSVSNFALLFVFWEAVGVCSYLLIGFWYEKPEAASAGKKAFLVNRVGDFGFALAIFLIWTTYGTLNFHDTLPDGPLTHGTVSQATASQVATSAPAEGSPAVVRGVLSESRNRAGDYVGGGVALAICLLLMLGACGKSAQFPLHVWLPDAMEGPSPVSALIHAATMVTAGVYMVARCTPLFMASPEAQLAVACIGSLTALIAGLIAVTQFDLKRVLAYSTVSQLGFMFLGLGTGTLAGITAGMFHLFTHAFFKALLFLGAGSVMHAMGNVIDMRRFSGLRVLLPITHATFLLGCLALAGIPPFAGFFSKDAILAAVEEKAHELAGHDADHSAGSDNRAPYADASSSVPLHSPVSDLSAVQRAKFATIYQSLYYIALFTAFLTAFYTFRAFYLTFYGPQRIPHEAGDHAHESPPIMWLPLAVLAVCALVVGFYFDRTYLLHPTHQFAEFIGHTPSLASGLVAATRQPYQFHIFVAGVSTVVALAGWLLSTYFYLGDHSEIRWLKSLMDFDLASKWFDVETVSRWKDVGWIAATHRLARRYGLGGVTSTVGHFVLLVVLILATPFLLGNYLSPYKLSFGKFFFDEIYQLTIIVPLRFVATACYAIDRWVIDGLVNAVARIPPAFGSFLRSLQMGLVQFYALAMVLGILLFLALATGVLWAAG